MSIRHLLAACLALPLTLLVGCTSERTTAEQCQFIFDRLVVLELQEMGFNDPVVTARRQAEFAVRYQAELAACVGQPIRPGALECVASARSVEALSHECLH